MQQVIILGAGLSGLTTAYELKKMGIRPVVLEARGRYGGRIWTLEGEGRATPLEMGATWFGEKHQHLMGMLLELGVGFFNQYDQGKNPDPDPRQTTYKVEFQRQCDKPTYVHQNNPPIARCIIFLPAFLTG